MVAGQRKRSKGGIRVAPVIGLGRGVRGSMSKRARKILALSLVMVLFLTLVACVGGGPATQTGPAQEEVTQLAIRVASATAAADTSKFDMNMVMVVEIIGGAEPGKLTVSAVTAGAVDNKGREMHLTMDMGMDIPGQDAQLAGTAIYAVGDWIYMQIVIPGDSNDQWLKTGMTEELWNSQNQFVQQLALLAGAEEVSFVGRESVRGVECNAVEIKPSGEALSNLLAQQVGGAQDILNLEQLLQTGLKGTSLKEWIAVDSNLLMKSALVMSMEGKPSDFGADEETFDNMTVDITMDFEAYDYNQPVTIELPQEALSAQEVSG